MRRLFLLSGGNIGEGVLVSFLYYFFPVVSELELSNAHKVTRAAGRRLRWEQLLCFSSMKTSHWRALSTAEVTLGMKMC